MSPVQLETLAHSPRSDLERRSDDIEERRGMSNRGSAPGSSSSPPNTLRCRGGGATPPPSPGSPVDAANELQVAAEIQQLLRRTRKRKLEIVERDAQQQLEALSTEICTEQTSWEREAAPSPSSRRPVDDEDDNKVEDSAAECVDGSDHTLVPQHPADAESGAAAVAE